MTVCLFSLYQQSSDTLQTFGWYEVDNRSHSVA